MGHHTSYFAKLKNIDLTDAEMTIFMLKPQFLATCPHLMTSNYNMSAVTLHFNFIQTFSTITNEKVINGIIFC